MTGMPRHASDGHARGHEEMQAGVSPNCRMSGRHSRFRCYLSETAPAKIEFTARNERTNERTGRITDGRTDRQTDTDSHACLECVSQNVAASTLFRPAMFQPRDARKLRYVCAKVSSRAPRLAASCRLAALRELSLRGFCPPTFSEHSANVGSDVGFRFIARAQDD